MGVHLYKIYVIIIVRHSSYSSAFGVEEMSKQNPKMNDKATLKLLFHAIMKGQYKSLKILIDGGANVNAMDKRGKSALVTAVEEVGTSPIEVNSARYKIVVYLLDNGADPKIADKQGETVERVPLVQHIIGTKTNSQFQNDNGSPQVLSQRSSPAPIAIQNSSNEDRFRKRSVTVGLSTRSRNVAKEDVTQFRRKRSNTNGNVFFPERDCSTEFTSLFDAT